MATEFKSRRGFTLVELLVVLAIIAVLIAILMPVLSRVRRVAAVLASPIAYTSKSGSVQLTDPNGSLDVSVKGIANMECPVCHSPPVWSPTGDLLAFRVRVDGGFFFTGVAEPSPNRLKLFRENGVFISWEDSDHWIMADGPGGVYHVNDIRSNTIQRYFDPSIHPMYVSPAPPGAPGRYIGVVYKPPYGINPRRTISVSFLKSNLTEGRNIWSTSSVGPLDVDSPRVDTLGENVAWSLARSPGDPTRFVAVKNIRDPTGMPPTLIGGEFVSAHLCDWSENGNILANVSSNNKDWNLAIFDCKGRLVKKLATTTPPAQGHIASWRKYLHR